jgi:hypothetical protein
MAGEASVIKEFLASVGFRADEKSLKASLTKVAAFGAAVQLVAAGIYAGLVKVASGEAEIAKKADQLGTTSDKLQELGYVAEQSGSSIDAVTRSMESLLNKNPRIRDAAKALEMAGERMKRMSEAQRKAYADNMGIDRSLIPMLISDTGKLTDEFRAMYAVAGYDAKEAGQASKEFMGEIGKLSTIVGLLAKSVSLAFIGRIRHDVANLRKVIMENFDKIKRLMEGAIKIILRIASVISAFAYRVITWISALVGWYDKLDDGQKKVIIGVGLLLAAWKLLNAGFLATPIGMIITGLLAIVALVDDYLTYMEGGESYFDWGPWAETIEDVVRALKPVLGVVLSIGKGIASAIGPALKVVIDTIGRVINHFKLLAQFVMAIFSGDFGKAADMALAIFTNLGEMLLGIFTGMGNAIKTILLSLWDGVVANFPDFAAWAAGAVKSMRELFGKGIRWIKDKISSLVDFLPDWVLEKMGMKPGGGSGDDKPGGGGRPGDDGDFDKAINDALAASRAASAGAALTPSPAQAAGMTQNTQQTVSMDAKTEINVYTSDPVAAGNQAADRQAQVNADTVRHMKGAAK